MELTNRQIKVFKTIVEEFTRTAEPVGSHTLMSLLDIKVSSATLRNEMAALEEMGLLEKTHTSSGRIPSSKGYRYYVDHLMVKHIEPNMMNALQTVFDARNSSMEEVVRQSCDILSQMTNLTSLALGPDSRYQSLQHISLIPLNEKSAVAISTKPGYGVRYVLPQTVSTTDKDVSLFLRVTQPFGKVKFTVRSGDKVLAVAKKLKAAPGEMEKITVKAALLQDVKEPITVSLEEL